MAKFKQQYLKKHIITEWKQGYLDYKTLKKVLK